MTILSAPRTPHRGARPPWGSRKVAEPHFLESRLLRAALAATALGAAVLLAGCAGTSPPVQLVVLRVAPPAAVVPAAPSPWVWQLATPVRVPDYLDRDALLVPQGQAGLQALPGYRWAEPLRESLPRLLREDLAALLGEARVWAAPVPPGVQITRQLRVELLALEANSQRSAVTLRARWTITDPSAAAAPIVGTALLSVPSAGTDVDDLVAAHRLAVWRLAERIAATGRAP